MQHCIHQCTIMHTECKIIYHNIDVKDVLYIYNQIYVGQGLSI